MRERWPKVLRPGSPNQRWDLSLSGDLLFMSCHFMVELSQSPSVSTPAAFGLRIPHVLALTNQNLTEFAKLHNVEPDLPKFTHLGAATYLSQPVSLAEGLFYHPQGILLIHSFERWKFRAGRHYHGITIAFGTPKTISSGPTFSRTCRCCTA
jgi:hypothetical protein